MSILNLKKGQLVLCIKSIDFSNDPFLKGKTYRIEEISGDMILVGKYWFNVEKKRIFVYPFYDYFLDCPY